MSGLRLVLAGAAIGNGNRGVEALGRSVIDAVDRECPDALLTVLDDGWGTRQAPAADNRRSRLEYVGVRRSRRWHRPESWARIRLSQAIGARGNTAAQRFAAADALLDLSAGDSFTDLYGPVRLESVSAPKDAALRAGTPLVLLPQTYGPFSTTVGRRRAEHLVRSATLAYSRDSWSYEQLVDLAGPSADPSRLRQGVDVAFALEPAPPADEVIDQLAAVMDDGPVVGVNASGLLRDAAGHTRFGLAGDYLDTMTSVVRQLIAAGAHVVLVPHVHLPGGHHESDIAALSLIRDRLEEHERRRTSLVPPDLSAAELKWCISQLDWFVGSRMHATIAALSTLTPTAAYAYSDKTAGVFETCGVGAEVIDARRTGGPAAVEAILDSFARRDTTKDVLESRARATIDRSRAQLLEVFDSVARWRDAASRAETIA